MKPLTTFLHNSASLYWSEIEVEMESILRVVHKFSMGFRSGLNISLLSIIQNQFGIIVPLKYNISTLLPGLCSTGDIKLFWMLSSNQETPRIKPGTAWKASEHLCYSPHRIWFNTILDWERPGPKKKKKKKKISSKSTAEISGFGNILMAR